MPETMTPEDKTARVLELTNRVGPILSGQPPDIASARMITAAIGHHYQLAEIPFDTRSPVIQLVMRTIRARLRARGGRG